MNTVDATGRTVSSALAALVCLASLHGWAGGQTEPPERPLFAAAALLAAADARPGDEVRPRVPDMHRLTVRPRATTRPALEYRLLPDPADRTPGNAATVYLMAFLQAVQVPQAEKGITAAEATRMGLPAPEDTNQVHYFLSEVPLAKLPQEQVARFLDASYGSPLRLFDLAARRESCRWDMPIRELGFDMTMPHLNAARELANVSALEARLRIALREYAAAVRMVQNDLQLARDLSRDRPFLIQSLVGAGVGALALKETEELVQQPDAPNLYWPLADLPRPLVDMKAALEGERSALVLSFPQLRRARSGQFTAQDWQAFVARMRHDLDNLGARRDMASAPNVGAAMAAVVLYPRAKQFLIDQGVPAAEVEAMPVPAVVMRYQVGQYDQWWDEVIKWAGMPFWQAYPGIQRATAEFDRARATMAGNPLLAFMPAVNRALFQGARLDRQVAALQTVEALRNYAAAHDGGLPARLEDMTDTPAPLDPTTGRPFGYTLSPNGHELTLESPPPGGPSGDPRDGLRVEVTFVK